MLKRGFSLLAVLALIIVPVVSMTSVAFADQQQVDNDLASSGNQNIVNISAVAGETVSTNAQIVINYSGNNHLAAGANVTFSVIAAQTNLPSGYSVAPVTLTVPTPWSSGGIVSGTSAVSFTAPADAGTHSYTVKWGTSEDYGNSLTGAPALVINLGVTPSEPPSPADITAPVVTPTVTGTLGNNGWYVSDVTVTWTTSDPESSIGSATGCGITTLTSDTVGTTVTCSATNGAGLTTSSSVTVKIDKTAPTISGSRTPAPNANGWNNTDVFVSFSCADSVSGIAACSGDTTVSTEGAGQSVTGTAIDFAGNTSSATVGNINIDKTAPTISITSPSGSYVLGQPVAASYSCTDALSGADTCVGTVASGSNIDTASIGAKSFSVNATDAAGNTASASTNYSVVYNWCGFKQPLLVPVTTYKTGSTIPVKFCVADYNGNPIGNAVATVSPVGSNGNGVDRYDADAGQYIYNLQTKGMATGSLTITVTLNDGTTHSVVVALK